ncbi:hypothetical protein ACFL3C_04575 [Patescibacteria group bacterium]
MDEKGRKLGDEELDKILAGTAPESCELTDGKLMRFAKKVGAPIAVAATMILGGTALGCDNQQQNTDTSGLDGGVPDTVPEDSRTYPFASCFGYADLGTGSWKILYTMPEDWSFNGTIALETEDATYPAVPFDFEGGTHIIEGAEVTETLPDGALPTQAVIKVRVGDEVREIPVNIF